MPEQEGSYDIFMSDEEDEFYIIIRHRDGEPEQPKIIYDGKEHAVFYRNNYDFLNEKIDGKELVAEYQLNFPSNREYSRVSNVNRMLKECNVPHIEFTNLLFFNRSRVFIPFHFMMVS